MIFDTIDPTAVVLDPNPENLRAIRCYEKAGIRLYETIANSDGSMAYMMRRLRSEGDGPMSDVEN